MIKRKMTVIPNPVKEIQLKKFPKKSFNRKTLLNIGRLERQKDHLTLIKAFSIILNLIYSGLTSTLSTHIVEINVEWK